MVDQVAKKKRQQFGYEEPSKVPVLRSRIPQRSEERKLRPARKSQTRPAGQEANRLLFKKVSAATRRLEQAPKTNGRFYINNKRISMKLKKN